MNSAYITTQWPVRRGADEVRAMDRADLGWGRLVVGLAIAREEMTGIQAAGGVREWFTGGVLVDTYTARSELAYTMKSGEVRCTWMAGELPTYASLRRGSVRRRSTCRGKTLPVIEVR